MKDADKKYWFLFELVLVVYAAVQSVAIGAPWFPADDAQELAFVRQAEAWSDLLGVDAFGLFRPLKNLIFLGFAALEPYGMPVVRTAAIAVGILSFFPVYAFFGQVFDERRYALTAAAVWLLSPTLVSSVTWLSCVNIQLMSGLAAAAFTAHDREHPVLAAVLLFLACTAYELAVVVGPLIVVFDFFLRSERLRERRTWIIYVGYALVTLGFLVLRAFVGSVHSVSGSFANCTRLDVILSSAYLTCQHFLTWLWPFGRMAVFGGYAAGSVSLLVLILAWLVLAGLALAAFLLRRRQPIVAFGLALALVGFLPVSNLTGVGNGPYGDYYLALSSLGFAALAASLCTLRVGRFAVGALRLAALAAAFQWAWLWADGYRAFFAAAENFPAFFGNRIFLVTHLADAGMWEGALALGQDVERLVGSQSGQMSGVHLARGLYELRNGGNADTALKEFELSRKADDFGGALRNRDYYLGCVHEDMLGDTSRAEKLYASSLRGEWNIDSVQPADRLARLLAERGETAAAIELWRKALKVQPDNRVVRHNLELTLKKSGDAESSVR